MLGMKCKPLRTPRSFVLQLKELGSREEWPGINSLFLQPTGCGCRNTGRWRWRNCQLGSSWSETTTKGGGRSHHLNLPPVLSPHLCLHMPKKNTKIPTLVHLPYGPQPDWSLHLGCISHMLVYCFKKHNLLMHCSRSFHLSLFVVWEFRCLEFFPLIWEFRYKVNFL